MKSLIYDQSIRYIKFFMRVLALWVFLRGHSSPGGGFAAALIAASAEILQALGSPEFGPERTHKLFRQMGFGLLLSLGSGILALCFSRDFMTGIWIQVGSLELGTPMFFDGGIFLLVYSATTLMTEVLIEKSFLKEKRG
jgi:multisubunit Na+/H+ antiporter MnhB subunit